MFAWRSRTHVWPIRNLYAMFFTSLDVLFFQLAYIEEKVAFFSYVFPFGFDAKLSKIGFAVLGTYVEGPWVDMRGFPL